ncbi:cell envelope integrity EipB family protein [Afifella pfennigii]|uniref:cell envelope integrity EipB family protein n=1 Tax=Afifella pfennigii TaxID=209897 RepID=UPI0012EBB560|nr:cell envelope integrity EipB family protein [Afifella pfennigii]
MLRIPFARPLAGIAGLFLLTAATPLPAPQQETAPVPHRAVYDIRLAESTDASGIDDARGRMVFEVSGNACEGFSMTQRLVVNLIGGEEGDRLLDFRVSTFEGGDGQLYRFASRTYLNDRIIEDVEGVARREDGRVVVDLSMPHAKTVEFKKPPLFPGQHLNALLTAARADQRFLSSTIYEGSGTGERTDTASAIIGLPGKAGGPGPDAPGAPQSPLMHGMHWPVSIAYFNEESEDPDALGEEVPAYQMSFTLYENGVTRNLVMDYGDYVLSGELQGIEELATTPCSH